MIKPTKYEFGGGWKKSAGETDLYNLECFLAMHCIVKNVAIFAS